MNTAVEFRLSRHPSADRLRGYLAYSIRSLIRPYATNTVLYYLHQSTIFHNKDITIFDYYHENTWFSLEEDSGLVKKFFKMTAIDLK